MYAVIRVLPFLLFGFQTPVPPTASEQTILGGAEARIEQYRKADAIVLVEDGHGEPIPGARIKVEQLGHSFLFGCNAFPLLQQTSVNREELYQREFAALFNYATLGFYWSAYEREKGQTSQARITKQAQWCRGHGI